MKIIITESQHNKLRMRQWVLRRQELFMREYNEAVEDVNPCNHEYGERYVNRVIHQIMDGLHPQFYLIDNFDYELLFEVIHNMIYDDLIKKYNLEIENCG